MERRGVDLSGSVQEKAAGSFEHGHQTLVSLNARKLLTSGGKSDFLRRTLFQRVENKTCWNHIRGQLFSLLFKENFFEFFSDVLLSVFIQFSTVHLSISAENSSRQSVFFFHFPVL
jgi:hypothetical protein